jgi:hypothetical protein
MGMNDYVLDDNICRTGHERDIHIEGNSMRLSFSARQRN